MKIGDRVQRMLDGAYGIIIGPFSAGSPAWTVEFDDGHKSAWYQVELHPVSTPKFKSGDRVRINSKNLTSGSPFIGQIGTFCSYKLGSLASVEIKLDNDNCNTVWYESSLDLLPPLPIPASTTSGNTITVPMPVALYYGSPVSIGVDPAGSWNGATVKHDTHSCNWKFYMGLNQRYEYCTICDKKRDTDRRS